MDVRVWMFVYTCASYSISIDCVCFMDFDIWTVDGDLIVLVYYPWRELCSHVALDENLGPGYNTLLLLLIPGDLYSVCPHGQFNTPSGLLHSRVALPNSCYPNACIPSRETVCIISMMVFGMTQMWHEPMTYHIRGGHAFTTETSAAVACLSVAMSSLYCQKCIPNILITIIKMKEKIFLVTSINYMNNRIEITQYHKTCLSFNHLQWGRMLLLKEKLIWSLMCGTEWY